MGAGCRVVGRLGDGASDFFIHWLLDRVFQCLLTFSSRPNLSLHFWLTEKGKTRRRIASLSRAAKNQCWGVSSKSLYLPVRLSHLCLEQHFYLGEMIVVCLSVMWSYWTQEPGDPGRVWEHSLDTATGQEELVRFLLKTRHRWEEKKCHLWVSMGQSGAALLWAEVVCPKMELT